MNKAIKISFVVFLMSIGFFLADANVEAKTATATCINKHAGFCGVLGLSSGQSTVVNFESAKSKLEAYYNKNSGALAWSYMEGSGSTYYWVCVNMPVIRFDIHCTPSWGNCSKSCGTGWQYDGCGGSKKCNTHPCPIPGACKSGLGAPSGGLCTTSDNILSKASSGLCASGDRTSFGGSGTDAEPWTWSCNGKYGSKVNKNCCARLAPGRCAPGSNPKEFTYPKNGWPTGFNFCDPDSAYTIPSSVTLNQLPSDATSASVVQTTWDCETANGGTTNSACIAELSAPTVSCGPQTTLGEINTEPAEPPAFCESTGGGVTVSPVVALTSGGNWTWGCQHNDFSNIIADPSCSRPSCIASDPINVVNPIMLSEDMKSHISLDCPGSNNLCCTVTSDRHNIPVTVCSGKPGDIKIEPGVNDLSAICWFDETYDPNNPHNPNNPNDPNTPACNSTTETCIIDVNVNSVSTACMESQCTASGTCAKAPIIAADKTACKSSCNSNADCSSGRMIETKP